MSNKSQFRSLRRHLRDHLQHLERGHEFEPPKEHSTAFREASTHAVRCKSHGALLGLVTMVTFSQSDLGTVPLCVLWVSALHHNNSLAGRKACEVERLWSSLQNTLPLESG